MRRSRSKKPNWKSFFDSDLQEAQANAERTDIGSCSDSVNVEIHLTPDDIPRAYRGYTDSKSKRFIMEFRYADEEDFEKKQVSDFIFLRVGKHSGIVYGFEVDAEQLKQTDVTVKLIKAVRGANVRRPENKAILAEILDKKRDQFERLVAHR